MKQTTALPHIFTIEIDSRSTVTFEASNLREASKLLNEDWLRTELFELESYGASLWDGKARMRARYATEAKEDVF